MSEQDDIDTIAGEYVLGTLDASERADVDRRRQREPALDEAICFWERQLSSLDYMAPEVRANETTWSRIAARTVQLDTHKANGAIAYLNRRVKLWRATAVLSALIALGFGLGLWNQIELRRSEQTFVAVLQEDALSPYFIVEIDVRNRTMAVRPVAAKARPGKSYELWLIDKSLGVPRSLGVVADQGFTVTPVLVNYDTQTIEDGIYAITEEPLGGSPDGKPSGAPLWTSKLFQATP